MTFVSPDGAAHLLEEPCLNIMAANKVLFPLLLGQVSASEEALVRDFTGELKGYYVDPTAVVLVWPVIMELEPLFTPAMEQLCRRFPDY